MHSKDDYKKIEAFFSAFEAEIDTWTAPDGGLTEVACEVLFFMKAIRDDVKNGTLHLPDVLVEWTCNSDFAESYVYSAIEDFCVEEGLP